MQKPLKVLVVDDSEEDAELVLRELKRAGYELTWQRVQTRETLRESLERERWDLALCDYSMPELDALTAVGTIRERILDLPVIVVSGTIGEERAVECMRAGAQDMVLKDRLARLVPAVEREIAEARRHAEERHTTEQLERAQETLARTEKLRLLGQMAAGISHDLKNLLNPLSLYLDLADRALARGDLERARSSVSELKGVIQIGVDTVDRLRVFSRPTQEMQFTRIDLDTVAREAMALGKARVKATFPRSIEIRPGLGGPAYVLGESSDLVSAVLNLIANAIDAMPNGGIVGVRTGRDKEQSWIEVRDTGNGMPPEIREQIFEPFFSTKGDQGTGLGLAMVRSAMLRHEGKISVESEPGKGTNIRLVLPADKDS